MSAFFHISWFRIFIISYDIGGHLESENIVNNNIILISFFSRVYITYWDLTIFTYLCLFRGFLFNMCLFRDFLFNMCLFRDFLFNICLFKGFLHYLCLFWGYRFINFKLINYFLWSLLECQVFLGYSSSGELHPLSRQVYHASGVF